MCAVPVTAIAQRAQVVDDVRLNLRPDPSLKSPPVGVVVSSDDLTVVEKATDSLRVRTADGREGWVSRDYVVVEETPAPAQARVQDQVPPQAQAQVHTRTQHRTPPTVMALEMEMAAVRKTLDSYKTTVGYLEPAVAIPAVDTVVSSGGITPGHSAGRNPVSPGKVVLWGLLMLLTTGAGFAAGLYYHRWQVVRRLGGFHLHSVI